MVEVGRGFVAEDEVHQFAQEVVDFSSQYGSDTSISYTVSNLSGRCNIYPSYGDYTQAAVLRTYGPWWKLAPSARKPFGRTPSSFISEDFVDLSFKEKVFPSRIEIYETYNPGSVIRILACDTSSWSPNIGKKEAKVRWCVLWSGRPERNVAKKSRIFIPILSTICPFATDLIRLEFNSCQLDYYAELDAVCLVGSKAPPPNMTSFLRPLDNACANVTPCANGSPYSTLLDQCETAVDAGHQLRLHDQKILSGFLQLHLLDGLSAALDVSDNGYFDMLPQEVIQLIISYLDFASVCSLAISSHLFYKHCYDPMQYTELDLQPYWTKICDFSLSALHNRCCKLQRLNLSWCGGQKLISVPALQSFLKGCCSELVCLRLACCTFVDGTVLQSIANDCLNLQELDLRCCRKVPGNAFINLSKLKKLQRLNVYHTSIDSSSILAITRSCCQLEHLNLGSCTAIQNYDAVAVNLAKHCSLLKSLDVWRAKSLTNIGLKALSSGCVYLEELDAGWCSDLHSGTGCFVELVQNCRRLRKLYLTANRTVCDKDLEAVANYSRHLQQLDILGTREVSVYFLHRVLEKCTEMKFLDISFCSGVDSLTIDHWRQRFHKVDIKRSFQNTLDTDE